MATLYFYPCVALTRITARLHHLYTLTAAALNMNVGYLRRAVGANHVVRFGLPRSKAMCGGVRRACNVALVTFSPASAMIAYVPRSFCSQKRVGVVQVRVPSCSKEEAAHPPGMIVPLRRLVRRLTKILQLLLRALTLLLAWSPIAVSGCIVGLLARHRALHDNATTELKEAWWRALLKVIEFSGPTFIKAAQWMSTRRDSFPEEVCNR